MTYKHQATLKKIRDILIKYEPNLEAMCDLATCMLYHLVPAIEIIAGEVNHKNYIWAYDTKEKYYIDITAEQLLCSQDIKEFEKRGYVITSNFHIWNGAFEMLEELKNGPVLIDNGKEITLSQLLAEFQKKKTPKRWSFFGTRRRR
jgi:hypothetical protein